MQLKMKWLFFAFAFYAPHVSSAGTAVSGGGGAMVCRNVYNYISSAELLDIWEANNIRGERIVYTSESVDQQVNLAIGKLMAANPAFGTEVLNAYKIVLANQVNLPPNIALAPPKDANTAYQKPGCTLEGMMLFDDQSNKLYIDRAIFSVLSDTDKAAALMHESVYKVLRSYGDQNSIRSRAIVGRLFGSLLDTSDLPSRLPKHGVKRCANTNIELYMYEVWSTDGTNTPTPVMQITRVGNVMFPLGAQQSFQKCQFGWCPTNSLLVVHGFDATGVPSLNPGTLVLQSFSSLPSFDTAKGELGPSNLEFYKIGKTTCQSLN
ncbi:hypothetical protein [Bdellovibrio sp. HCB274]|uniref:hypothetical protein n=1 Tax=Bdellovibrio sp. HCB274 TaxID=3394361 RepID=UPI0039B64855